MDKTKDIYSAVYKFIDDAVLSIKNGVPDNDVKLEIVYETQEWRGIRILRTPSSRELHTFIDGKKEFEFNVQLASRQSIKEKKLINYAAYLDKLAGVLEKSFKTAPPSVSGIDFKDVSIAGGSTLIFSNGEISIYAIDVKFVCVA